MKLNHNSVLSSRMGIYKITNIVSSNFYIGSTKNLKKRFKNHYYDLKNRHYNWKMHKEKVDYGFDSFVFEILEFVNNVSDLLDREQFYIDILKPTFNIYLDVRTGNFDRKQTSEQAIINHCLACATSKLTEEDVIKIINLLNLKLPIKEISKQFNIVDKSVQDIKNGNSYKHLSYLLNKDIIKLSNSKFTHKQVLKIIDRINNGELDGDIAKDFNVSARCITGIRHGNRLKKYNHLIINKERSTSIKFTDEEKEDILDMLNKNISIHKIAKKLNYRYATMRNFINKLKINL